MRLEWCRRRVADAIAPAGAQIMLLHRRTIIVHRQQHDSRKDTSSLMMDASTPTARQSVILRPRHGIATLLHSVLRHWPLLVVLAAFASTLLVIPALANVPVGDDWVYTRSVEILVNEGRLEILDLSVVNLVFQIVWGAIFSLGGVTFATTRLSTIVLVLLSGPAMYALLRELGVGTGRSALGAALYLFNPLTFGLAFTFMTDPHFTALLVMATWAYVRGLAPERLRQRWIVAASALASLAFLVRQQGILIPFAAGLYLVLAGRWKPDAEGLRLALRVAGIPALVMALFYAWLLGIHGAPEQQGQFLTKIIEAGVDDSRILIARMTFIEIAYIGCFVLPVTLAALPALRRRHLPATLPGWLFLSAWTVIAIAGALVFAGRGKFMPYIPQYASFQGIGPTDLRGGRDWLVDGTWGRYLTIACLLSTMLFALVLARPLFARATPRHASAMLVASIGLWQVVGVLPPSFHFRNWIISVDRYLLPLVPLAIALLLWALRDIRIMTPVAWLIVALMAAFSIAGTRDFLVFQQATWDVAREAVARGVPLTKLDAGASWDGYYLYDYSVTRNIDQQTPGGPWWTDLFGPATDSTWVVATRPQPGYEVVLERPYSSWLDREEQTMLLMRRIDAAHIP